MSEIAAVRKQTLAESPQFLGAVPARWSSTPMRAVLRRRRTLVGSRSGDYPLLSLTTRGVIVRDLTNMKGKFPASFDTYQIVEAGDLVLCLFDVDETPRTVGMCEHPGMITGAYDVYQCSDDVTGRYVLRLLTQLDDIKGLKPLYRGLRKTVPRQAFETMKFGLPPLDERTAIVRYLDHADLRISRAVQAKLQLACLLEEKKRVLVEAIVLRGSKPSARLVDSGVPWLGDVPEHWELLPARALLRRSKRTVGKQSSKYQLLSLTLKGVVVRDLDNIKGKFPASFDTYQVVEPGDFVMCLFDVDETPRAVGLSADSGMITGAYDVYKCLDDTARDYLYQLLLSIDNGKKLKPIYRGLRKVVPTEAFASMRLVLPPPPERSLIVSQLKAATSDLDNALAAIRGEIDLLREYRTRLVADVVTGNKDVRAAAVDLPDADPEEMAAVLSGIPLGVEGEVGDAD